MLCCYGHSTNVIIPFSSFQLFSKDCFYMAWGLQLQTGSLNLQLLTKKKKKKEEKKTRANAKTERKILLLGLITTSRHTGRPHVWLTVWKQAIREHLGLLVWNSHRGLPTTHPFIPPTSFPGMPGRSSVCRGKNPFSRQAKDQIFL